MNRINEYLEPGVYSEGDNLVVLVDVLTHSWNSVEGLQEALPVPIVMVRNLNELKDHVRMGYPIDVFKEKFSQI